jgi:hypothetical protein
MSRDKLGLIPFGLILLGFIIYIKTENYFLFALGVGALFALIFVKSKYIK